jgi:hypothetical protein
LAAAVMNAMTLAAKLLQPCPVGHPNLEIPHSGLNRRFHSIDGLRASLFCARRSLIRHRQTDLCYILGALQSPSGTWGLVIARATKNPDIQEKNNGEWSGDFETLSTYIHVDQLSYWIYIPF